MKYLINNIPGVYSDLILSFLKEFNISVSSEFILDKNFFFLKPHFEKSIITNNFDEFIFVNDSDSPTVYSTLIPLSTLTKNKSLKIISIKRDIEEFILDTFIFGEVTYNNSTNQQIREKKDEIIAKIEKHSENAAKMSLEINKFDYNNKQQLVLSLKNLINADTQVIQINEFKKILFFFNLKFDEKQLISRLSNALNKNRFQSFNYNSIDYKELTNDIIKKSFKKYSLNKINVQNGFAKSNLQKLKSFFGKTSLSFYDKYWSLNAKGSSNWVYGINIVDHLIENFEFDSVLDAGCGAADVVKYLKQKDYNAKGVELSGEVLKLKAPELLKKGIVQQGSLLNLPFPDNHFDVVFSSEVLEHIPEVDIPKTISELTRVSKNLLFLTISLRPSSNFNKYHTTLKSRGWWEQHFIDSGCVKNTEMQIKFQKVEKGLGLEGVLETGPTKSHIDEMKWFIEENKYSLNGELEPWFFIFNKNV